MGRVGRKKILERRMEGRMSADSRGGGGMRDGWRRGGTKRRGGMDVAGDWWLPGQTDRTD